MPDSALLTVLARSFTNGEPSVPLIVGRAARVLGRSWRWLPPLARRYTEAFGMGTRPRQRDVIQFLRDDPGFGEALAKYFSQLSVDQWLGSPQIMQPVEAAKTWNLPSIATTGELAYWLGLHHDELAWFGDLKGLLSRSTNRSALLHYHFRVLAKSFDSVRLIEAPKPRLKQLQRQILTSILEKIPSHPVVHGFLKGRSIKTFVAPHVGRRVVLKMDLRDFFPSISGPRIQALFRTAGYPEPVADLLGGICTNSAPKSLWRPTVDVAPGKLQEAKILYSRPHLPQGAPTSPALANLCAYRADCRLSGLADAVGAAYTRYADDLAFSGDEGFEKCVERFSIHAAAILMEEGFSVHHRKTRIMRQGVRQRLAGLVTNQHANVMRKDFDLLKATLTNCLRHGPANQNRDAHPAFQSHLEGRVGFVEMINPQKGRRLRTLFEQIEWG
jgi:RNA-directed DNA polymerase